MGLGSKSSGQRNTWTVSSSQSPATSSLTRPVESSSTTVNTFNPMFLSPKSHPSPFVQSLGTRGTPIPCRSIQHQPADFLHITLTEFVVANQQAHIDCAVESIEHEVEVEVRGKLAAIDCAAQGLVRLLPSRTEKALAERL